MGRGYQPMESGGDTARGHHIKAVDDGGRSRNERLAVSAALTAWNDECGHAVRELGVGHGQLEGRGCMWRRMRMQGRGQRAGWEESFGADLGSQLPRDGCLQTGGTQQHVHGVDAGSTNPATAPPAGSRHRSDSHAGVARAGLPRMYRVDALPTEGGDVTAQGHATRPCLLGSHQTRRRTAPAPLTTAGWAAVRSYPASSGDWWGEGACACRTGPCLRCDQAVVWLCVCVCACVCV